MNVELNASVVIDDWQAVVNRTVANYFDSLGFEHLDQVLDMRVFDLLNMNLLDAVRVEEIIVCLYRSLNPNITEDEAMYCGAMNQRFDYTGWRKIHRQHFLIVPCLYDLTELLHKQIVTFPVCKLIKICIIWNI